MDFFLISKKYRKFIFHCFSENKKQIKKSVFLKA